MSHEPAPVLPVAPESPVPGMDEVAAKRWARRAASTSAWLHEEVARRMAERLDWIKATPADWLHWEPVCGGLVSHQALAARYSSARVWVHAQRPEAAQAALKHHALAQQGWWARWRYQPPPLWCEMGGVDMVWANMLLHTEHLPQGLLARWHRALRTDGFLMFSCLGPDSLRELRSVHSRLGWPPPAHDLTDMHDWGDMLVHTGFAEPVMDMERLVLTYSNSHALLADLRGLGRNLSRHRYQGTRTRSWWAAWHGAVEQHLPRDDQGRLVLTFEVIYGHAHKGRPTLPVAPTSAISLRDMKQMLGQGTVPR